MDEILFQGELDYKGLSNEAELIQKCPPEFKDTQNPWNCYAYKVMQLNIASEFKKWRKGFNLKIQEESKQKNQFLHLQVLIDHSEMPNVQKIPIVAWMLSGILVKIP